MGQHGGGEPHACCGVQLSSRHPGTPVEVLTRGVWRENPVLRQLLGLCLSLAVTNTVANSLAMGAATALVIVGSSFFVSALRKRVAPAVRLTTYVLIVATFVTWWIW